jgi:hypothetical protein
MDIQISAQAVAVIDDCTFVVGGYNRDAFELNVCEYDTNALSWKTDLDVDARGIPNRAGHTVDVVRIPGTGYKASSLVMFGGRPCDGNNAADENTNELLIGHVPHGGGGLIVQVANTTTEGEAPCGRSFHGSAAISVAPSPAPEVEAPNEGGEDGAAAGESEILEEVVALPPPSGVLVFGGKKTDGENLNDLWMAVREEKGQVWSWTKCDTVGTGPSPRAQFCMVEVSAGLFLVHGGHDGSSFSGDLYLLRVSHSPVPKSDTPTEDPPTGTEVEGGGDGDPAAEMAAVATTMLAEDLMFTWIPITPSAEQQQKAGGQTPSPRAAHSLVVCSPNSLLLFGGLTEEENMNDLWTLALSEVHEAGVAPSTEEDQDGIPPGKKDPALFYTWSLVVDANGSPPPPRAFHAMVAVQSQGEPLVLIHGGMHDGQRLGDLFVLDNHATEEEIRQADDLALGWGKQVASNGDAYEGRFENGAMQGDGVMKYASGDVYTGQWTENQREGEGKCVYNCGTVYEGEWSAGERCGKGKCTYVAGPMRVDPSRAEVSYEGDWRDGKREGDGTCTYENGDSYTGPWENDMKHGGGGTMRYGDRGVYTGQWSQDKRSGEGKMVYPDDVETYEGSWLKDKKEGTGTSYYRDGTEYTGAWREDKKNGIGKCVFGNRDTYDGKWKNGQRSGRGRAVFAAGHVYEGLWNTDQCDGRGLMNYVNGDVYDGAWAKGQRHGKGTCTYANSEVYTGDWVKGKRSGKGELCVFKGSPAQLFSKYTGSWYANLQEGDGQVEYKSGDLLAYNGSWKKGVQEGTGSMSYSNGNKYSGGWKKGLRSGQGTLTYANENPREVVYNGEWSNDMPHGKGVGTSRSVAGKGFDIYTGTWENGSRAGQGKCKYASGDEYNGEWSSNMRDGLVLPSFLLSFLPSIIYPSFHPSVVLPSFLPSIHLWSFLPSIHPSIALPSFLPSPFIHRPSIIDIHVSYVEYLSPRTQPFLRPEPPSRSDPPFLPTYLPTSPFRESALFLQAKFTKGNGHRVPSSYP